MSATDVLVRTRPRWRSRPGRGRVAAGVALTVVGIAVFLAIFGPLLAPHDPNATNLAYSFVGPIAAHPLGFDEQGRDLLSELLAATRPSLIGPTVVVLIAMLLGVALSVVAAWRGGWTDSVISTGLDILFAFPGILLAVLAAAVFGPSLTAAALALSIAYTPYIARVLRGAALRERAEEYIAAGEVQGQSAWVLCTRHLLPNLAPLIASQATLLFAYAFVDLAAISFLGLGVQPPQSDWGTMVAAGKSGVLQGYPAETLSAGLCIVVLVVAVNFLGERIAGRSERR
ncbi:MAG: ABC transporter permease [Solirubrobacterales bacterium]